MCLGLCVPVSNSGGWRSLILTVRGQLVDINSINWFVLFIIICTVYIVHVQAYMLQAHNSIYTYMYMYILYAPYMYNSMAWRCMVIDKQYELTMFKSRNYHYK